MKSYSTTFHKPNVLSLDKCRMIWVIQISLLHTHPSDSFLVRYLHFHVRHTILVSSFSRRGILTNQKHRRACDFTCSTFTASEKQVFAASRFERNLFFHGQITPVQRKCKIKLVLWVYNLVLLMKVNRYTYIFFLLLKTRFA